MEFQRNRSRSVVPALVVALAGASAPVSLAQECRLFPTSVYDAGRWSESGALADLDRDGHLDFACESYYDSRISIYFGDGTGRLGPEIIVPLTPAPESLHVADLDHDGDDDLLVSYSGAGSMIGSLLNRGDGTFDPPLTQSLASSLFVFALRDLNGDQFPDIVAMISSTSAGFCRGNGDGSFTLVQNFSGSSPSSTRGAAVEDFDGDGYVDVAFANTSTAYVYRNLQNTGFAAAEYYAIAPSGVYVLTGGDVDADGRGDLVFRVGDDLLIKGSLGRDGGGGPLQFWGALVADIGTPQHLRFADVDGDSHTDVIAGEFSVDTGLRKNLRVIRNLGERQFGDVRVSPAGWGIASLALGDLDHDGDPEVVSTSVGGGTVELVVVENRGGVLETYRRAGFMSNGAQAAFADFNGDERVDVLGANPSGGTQLTPMLNDGFGEFIEQPRIPILGTIDRVAAGDLDGDGYAEAIYSVTDGRVYVLPGAGDGTFGPPILRLMGTVAVGAGLADIDGDGLPDLTAIGGNYVYVRKNLGGLAFQPSAAYPIGFDATELIVTDLNGDGRDDIVVALGATGVRMLLAGVSGGLSAATVLYTGSNQRVNVGDLEGDGDIDVLINTSSQLHVLRNGGGATFTTESYAYPASGLEVAAVDLTGDGPAELVAFYNAGRFAILGGAPGPLTFLESHTIDRAFRAPEMHDADGDGDLDLYVQSVVGAAVVRNLRPAITDQPADVDASVGDTITLTVGLDAPEGWACQWYRSDVPLADGILPSGAVVSGATQPTLEMSGVGVSESGRYRAVLSDGCSTLRSRTVQVAITDDPCRADLDGDGTVALADLSLLLSEFGGTTTGPTDIDGDGVVGLGDLSILLSLYGASC